MSMETPPFTMHDIVTGQVAVWREYSSSETDGRIASYLCDSFLQLAAVS